MKVKDVYHRNLHPLLEGDPSLLQHSGLLQPCAGWSEVRASADASTVQHSTLVTPRVGFSSNQHLKTSNAEIRYVRYLSALLYLCRVFSQWVAANGLLRFPFCIPTKHTFTPISRNLWTHHTHERCVDLLVASSKECIHDLVALREGDRGNGERRV